MQYMKHPPPTCTHEREKSRGIEGQNQCIAARNHVDLFWVGILGKSSSHGCRSGEGEKKQKREGETGECVCVAWPVDLLAASGFGLQSSSTSTMPWWMAPIK